MGALGARLGVPCSAAEQACSLRPQDYAYPAHPSAAVLQRLQRQLSKAGAPASGAGSLAGAFGPAAALQGAAPGPAAAGPAPAPADAAKPELAGGMEDPFHAQLHLPELDDDCLRLLLGEDADESSAPAAAAQAGAPAAPAAAGSGNASEKSSACHAEEPAAAVGEVEAASRQPAHPEDDDDIAMLFGESRHAPSLEALELHLLGAGPLGAADDTSSEAGAEGSEGCVREAADAAGAGLKRQASEGLASPPGRGLMLHMNYEKAAESINLELLSGRSKPTSCAADAGAGFDPALLLSPLSDFPPLGCDTPESPDSLASGSDAVVPPPSLAGLLDSGSKRKRAVTAAV
ncbi:hypothetical protein COHA_007713 [Chlorella ohadii]|uniref:Uncharacterized protein n=1 Tax=Chlorella ohadii TaxID=2649997 RepID=A0AAD5DI70_9CHLO|nr:hypothetical protein COHA_007713 [Chlorella ohadii]